MPNAEIGETEPNNDALTASPAALGDNASAVVDPAGDVDWYVFTVATDTVVVLDVDASEAGSPLDPVLWLIASDGVTTLAFSDDADGLDSYIEYRITTPGQYYAVISDFWGDGAAGYFYQLSFDAKAPPPPGPGDPTTLFATDLGGPYGVAAGPAGEFYVTDVDGRRLLRVSSSGAVSELALFGSLTPVKAVLDGFGNLLVSWYDEALQNGISTVTTGGQVSLFAIGFGAIGAMTVGPDGDVWLLDIGRDMLYRLNPLGARKDSINVSAANPERYDADLAFSPSGVLHISNGYDRVYRLVDRALQPFLSGPPYLESLAFDRDGYLYVANGFLGTVLLYDPAGQPVSNPFALSNLGGPTYLAFGRSAAGALTSRLFATNYGYNLVAPYIGSMVEMNPAGMRAAGLRIGVDLLPISTASLPAAILGADYAATLQVTAPPGPPTWSIASGAFPPGLSLNGAAGTISGFPTSAGSFSFGVRVDAGGRIGYRGFTVPVSHPAVATPDAANHLLGSTQLPAELQRFFDLQGNRNGRYDIGDFRAYLRRQGQLPGGQQ